MLFEIEHYMLLNLYHVQIPDELNDDSKDRIQSFIVASKNPETARKYLPVINNKMKIISTTFNNVLYWLYTTDDYENTYSFNEYAKLRWIPPDKTHLLIVSQHGIVSNACFKEGQITEIKTR